MSEFKNKDWDGYEGDRMNLLCENCGKSFGEHYGAECEGDDFPAHPFAMPGGYKTALDAQVGGDHYKKLKIQPIEFIHANGIGFAEGNVIKYVTRWRDKNGIKDLEKARHFIDLLIQLETEARHG